MALTLDDIRKKKAAGFRVSRENSSKAVHLRPWETMNRVPPSDAASDESANRDQMGSNGIIGAFKWDHRPPETGSSSLPNGIISSYKWDQTPDNKSDHSLEIPEEACPSERPQLVDAASRATEIAHASVDPISRPPQTGSRNGIKWDPPIDLPTADQAQRVLLWLAKEQLVSGLGHTPRLQRGDIAKGVGISLHMVKVQITRLCASHLIERMNARRGRGPSGTVFRIADSVLVQLKRDQEMGSEASSSINIDPTTTQKGPGEFLRGTPFAEKRVVSDPVKNILKPVFREERSRGAEKTR